MTKTQKLIKYCQDKVNAVFKASDVMQKGKEFDIWELYLTRISKGTELELKGGVEDLSLRDLKFLKVELDEMATKLKELSCKNKKKQLT